MRAVVIIGGGPLDPHAVAEAAVSDGDTVIAADSGLDAAVAAGLAPDKLVGDLDSISAAGLAWAAASGIATETFPADKDATDTELALLAAARTAADDLVVLGGAGDRLDHLLGTLGVLGGQPTAGCTTVSAWLGPTNVRVARPDRTVTLEVPPGTTFSVVALHGPCTGVTISGARWPLDDAALEAGSTQGISNQSTGIVSISVGSGVLTVVIP